MRPRVMGVLNVTPDSFSDGGRWLDPDAAIAHGLQLVADGAAIVDIGGESTRPGAERVTPDEELRRVIPVVLGLASRASAGATKAMISIDTTKGVVAQAAIEAGATMVNDVSAGRFDPSMLAVVAEAKVHYVVMHMQGEPQTMQKDPRYADVVTEVGDFLLERIARAQAAGIMSDRIIADPGLGFGKTHEHNFEILARLPELVARVDVPFLIGASRKAFLGGDLGVGPDQRDEATAATVAWVAERGASIVRVHDVRGACHTLALLDVMSRATAEGLVA